METDARTKLIQAALPLFPKRGYAGVSIREIAEAAKVNSASISYYFGGKEGLYEAVLNNLCEEMTQIFDPAGLQSSPEDSIRMLAKNIVIMHQKSPYLVKYIFMEFNNPSPFFQSILKKMIEKFFRLLTDILAEGKRQKIFKEELDLRYAALSLSGIINFYYISTPMRSLILQEQMEGEETYVKQAVEIFLQGIRRNSYEKENP